MKRINVYICIVLLIPLFAAFSQAADIKGANCSHCNKQLNAQPDCCAMPPDADNIFGKCTATEKSSESCPHGGLCQAGDTIPVVLTSFVAPEMVMTTLYILEEERYRPRIAEKTFKIRPPPPTENPSIFLLHCSFLI